MNWAAINHVESTPPNAISSRTPLAFPATCADLTCKGEVTFRWCRFHPVGAGSFRAWESTVRSLWLVMNAQRWGMSTRVVEHRLDEFHQLFPQHGCIPAEPASVSPAKSL